MTTLVAAPVVCYTLNTRIERGTVISNPAENPYATPTSDLTEGVVPEHYGNATAQQRVLNLALDTVAYYVLSFFLGIFLAVVGGATVIEELTAHNFLYGLLSVAMYYFTLEALFGRTLGKLVTGSKVVKVSGGRANPLQIFVRTVTRFVPFEAFTYLGPTAVGLHDLWSKTRVVRVRPSKSQRAQDDAA